MTRAHTLTILPDGTAIPGEPDLVAYGGVLYPRNPAIHDSPELVAACPVCNLEKAARIRHEGEQQRKAKRDAEHQEWRRQLAVKVGQLNNPLARAATDDEA